MIQIQNLHKSFGPLQVLKGVNLDFPATASGASGITAILGPNGSGKTTLIKCILGMVIPSEGEIFVKDQRVKGNWSYRHNIGYLPQIARFPENLSVQELLDFIQDLRGTGGQPEPLIQRFGLEPFLTKRLGHLSGGTRQKVNLVLAFMYDCPLLILDEPTAGLDPVALIQLKALLKEEKAKGKHILITTHIMDFVEDMADEIVFLLEGNIHFRGRPDFLKKQYQSRKLENAIACLLQKMPAPSGGGVAILED
ncbi:MAG: ABC transporter [Saprospiraceae bacterium]|nr:MAG: ABC transporter [Saprospiraceae bacterium]